MYSDYKVMRFYEIFDSKLTAYALKCLCMVWYLAYK